MGDWKIWYRTFEPSGCCSGTGVVLQHYKRKGNAINRAERLFGGKDYIQWVVSQEYPAEWKE